VLALQGVGLVLSRLMDLQPVSKAAPSPAAWSAAAASASSVISEFAAHANTAVGSSSGGATARHTSGQEPFSWSPSASAHGRPPAAKAPATRPMAAHRTGAELAQHGSPPEAGSEAAMAHAEIKVEMYPHRKVFEMGGAPEAETAATPFAQIVRQENVETQRSAQPGGHSQAHQVSSVGAAPHKSAAVGAAPSITAPQEDAPKAAAPPVIANEPLLSAAHDESSSSPMSQAHTTKQQQARPTAAARRSSNVPVSSVERMARFTGLGLGIAFGTVGSLVSNTLQGSFKSSGAPCAPASPPLHRKSRRFVHAHAISAHQQADASNKASACPCMGLKLDVHQVDSRARC
jgi:hypothetical protein